MSDIYHDQHKELCPKAEHSECSKTLATAIKDFEAGVSKLKKLTEGTPWSVIAEIYEPEDCKTCEADASHAQSVDDAEKTYG